MLRNPSRSRNFFRKLVVDGVNNSKTALQNDCLMRLYDADAELKAISSELDSFDGKKEPVRCNLLVNQLRTAQDKVISLLFQLMDECSCERASRDYRMKFPDEILLSEGSESLNGQIWFGAECLSAGSNILNHTKESSMLRPMAKTLTTHLDSLRNDLRDLVLNGGGASRISQGLIKKMVTFDHIFATFEYDYVRTMLPIRTVAEIEKLQEVAVLFSETLIDCVKRGLIKQDDIDEFQPIVMIAIPRLAIVRGLLYKNENPIYTRHKSQMCNLFQPFHGPLHSIRKLLRGLSPRELFTLEKMLSNDQTPTESPRAKSASLEDKNTEESCKTNDASLQSSFANQSEAGTSNNFSNVLMEGLQYPVGQKREVESTEQSKYLDADRKDKYLETPSSSRSQHYSQNVSPVGTSNSSTSLSKKCDDEKATVLPETSANHECDKNCCLSPPENDAQLENLIAKFDPSMNSGEFSQNNSRAQELDEGTSMTKTRKKSSKARRSLSENSLEDEALLEELFMKQAQQLLHRLFVAISGVADQLQSNFASDLRFILRHIFSSEIEDDYDEDVAEEEIEDDSDCRADQTNDHSDSSLPIEQGIEAQEVVNLIDVEPDYSINSAYEGEDGTPNPQRLSRAHVVGGQSNPVVGQQYISNSHRFPPQNGQALDSVTSLPNQNLQVDELDTELLGDITRAADQYYSAQPSDLSREYNSTNARQQLQQFVHQQLLIARGPNRSSSASSVSTRSHRNNLVVENINNPPNSNTGERRSRRHASSNTRSRRVRGPPIWVPDQLVVACSCCNASFTLFRRRHHCRACGQIFCGDCSKFTKNLDCWGYTGPVRVCESCFIQDHP